MLSGIHRRLLFVTIFFVLVLALVVSSGTTSTSKSPPEQKSFRAPAKVVAILNRGGCGSCHTIPGIPGADGNIGPNLSELGKIAGKRREDYSARKYVEESIRNPNAFVAPGFAKGIMPSRFGRTLSKKDMEILVDYLVSLGVDPPKASNQERAKLDPERPPETLGKSFAKLTGKSPKDAEIVLGRHLFFDRRLSANNSLSCASCHQPDKHFTDGMKTNDGYPGTMLFRNTPTLWNVRFAKNLYWDGRLSGSDLPTLVRDHLTESFFMASDGRLLIERMNQVPEYKEMFRNAYGSEPGFGGILNSIAAYLKSLNTAPTKFDQFLAGEKNALNGYEQAGWELFRGKAGCVRCHPAPLFTDHKFHDLGLQTDDHWLFEEPERQITFRRFLRGLGVPDYHNLRNDPGHFPMSMNKKDIGKFRTPGLREVAHTAPYGHDGRFAKLEDVIEFYDQGGGKGQRADLKPLNLSKQEKAQLKAFLKTLSAPPVKVTVPVLPDYVVLPERERKLQWPPLKARKNDKVRTLVPITTLPEPPAPPDNPITKAKADLGRLLYFDTRLSGDSSVSCNTCHPANTGYTAQAPISMGGTGTSHWRNASTIYNVAYYQSYNWDGARTSIEKQNAGAWSGAVAGNMDADLAEERLYQIPEYRKRFRKVFGEETPTWNNALRAVATFQRTLNSKNVPFDAFLLGKESAISQSAQRGYRLFTGKAGCVKCHDGPLLADHRYHNLGVPPSPAFTNSPLRQITFRYEQRAKGVPRKVYESASDDYGLYYVTKRPEDVGKFRTPSLRELKHTAPYMHNGIFKTLPEVVAFYNRGGGKHPRKSPLLKALQLSKEEQQDLVAFLESLSGDPQMIAVPELPPYGPIPNKGGK